MRSSSDNSLDFQVKLQTLKRVVQASRLAEIIKAGLLNSKTYEYMCDELQKRTTAPSSLFYEVKFV